MKKIRNVLLLGLCAAMLVCASVAGTLAYLQDSKTVTNTMTVGKVQITLDETDVDAYGVEDGDTRVAENSYKLIPGRIYKKDPIIHIQKGSEPCYLFVAVENPIAAIEGDITVEQQMRDNGWVQLTGSNIWYHEDVWDARTATEHLDVPVFAEFCVKGDATNDSIASYGNTTITVTAYAVQADGFGSAEDAWNASFGAGNL